MKKLVAVFLTVTILCGGIIGSVAALTDNCISFLGNYYEVFSYEFEDGITYDWGRTQSVITLSKVLQMSGNADLLKDFGGFAGKSYFAFDLMADSIEKFTIDLGFDFIDGSSSETVKLELADDDADVRLMLNDTDNDRFLAGQWVKFELLFDGVKGNVTVIVSSESGAILRRSIYLKKSNAVVSSFVLNGGGCIYLDNIKLCRGLRCNNNKTAIFAEGEYISACSRTKPGEALYLAQYRDDRCIDYAVAKNQSSSPYTEVYLATDVEQGDVYKAFVWDEDLHPSKIGSVVKNDDMITTDFIMNGSVLTSDVTVGQQAKFEISFSDGYAGDVAVIIYSDDGKEAEIIQNAESEFCWTPSEPGKYCVWLYTVSDDILVLSANSTFYAVPSLTDDDTFMFPAEKPYYVHNGVRKYYTSNGYIPLLVGGHLYLNSDMIKELTGLVVSDGEVSYMGETLMQFDVDTGAAVDESGMGLGIKNGHYSFGDLCSLLGYESEMQEDVLCVTRADSISIYDYEDLLFEFVANKKSSGFYNWSTNNSVGAEYNKTTDVHTVSAIQSAFAGFSYKFLDDDFGAYMYEVSFDVMYSEDAENIVPFVGMWTKKDGNFFAIYHGSEITEGKSGEWTRVHSYFAKYNLDNAGFDTVEKFYIGLKPSGKGTAVGNLMFKNVRIREKSIMNESVESEIVCRNFASWHTLGEKVSFVSKSEDVSQFESICGMIYNSDGEKVNEKTVSVRSFLQNGWEWMPEDVGYYEAEFYGVRSDKSRSIIVNCYSHKYNNECTVYYLPRHPIAVVKSKAKPMDERSDLLMLSDDARSEDSMRLADMIGFSGIRIHGVHWGDAVQIPGFHTAPAEFDWTTTDLQINNVKKYGFKNVIANIFGTPRWAVTDKRVKNKGYTSVGLYTENCFVPDDISVVSEGFGAYAEKYKNDLTGIEVWNEPSYGNTAFWYQAGNTNEKMYEDFSAITSAAYSAIKEKAPDITVYSAGFNQAYKLFGELLKNKEYAKSFDAVSCHGRYSDSEVYFDILEQNNMSGKPVINSEGYFYAYHTKGVPKDYDANNMVFIMHYLQNIKLGTDKITHFSLLGVTEDEWRVRNNASNCAGLFRKYPYVEPLPGAVTAYNFFDGLGKDISFGAEFDFGNGIKAVSLKSDGEMQVYLWNSDDNSFYIPGELTACMRAESTVMDLEGRTVGKDSILSAKRFYCIKNADADSLNRLNNKPDSALDSKFVAPYYTCRVQNDDADDKYVPVSGVFTQGALFDKESFADNDGKCYNVDGEVWLPVDEGLCDVNAKYAVSFDAEGMYVEVIAEDGEYCAEASNGKEIVQYDGIRFAIDCYGRLRNTERSEFFVGAVNGKPSVYKHYAADLNEAFVEKWSPSGTMLETGCANIVRDCDKGVTIYKVYIPYSELYPFAGAGNSEVRFALAVGDNDGGIQKGYLSFGEGIATDLPEVWKYVKMNFAL